MVGYGSCLVVGSIMFLLDNAKMLFLLFLCQGIINVAYFKLFIFGFAETVYIFFGILIYWA